jgi:glycosyltransferase involved in cell wall biosynthesis
MSMGKVLGSVAKRLHRQVGAQGYGSQLSATNSALRPHGIDSDEAQLMSSIAPCSATLKISIVTPSFNQAAYIEETLWSVKNQNYPNIEHVVIDGASTDGSVDILHRYASLPNWGHLSWISEPDRGQTAAINKGFRLASGDIFAYLCADDRYAQDVFRFVASHFQSNPAIDLIYGECHFIDEAGTIMRRKRPVYFDRRRLLRANCIWQPTVFFRKRVWEVVGPFNENLQFAMDYEYWLRAAQTCSIQSVSAHLADYRLHSSSKTVTATRKHLTEAHSVACGLGGGGPWSAYLHKVYWPSTARFKWQVFRWLQAMRSS